MNILHTRRRIGLALMLAGALALPVATPVDAAAQNRPGQILDKDGNGKGKNKQAQKQRAQRQNARQGKVREQARQAQNRAHRQQQQANRAQDRARHAQQQANRARQNERRAEQQARRQHQEARRAQQHARQTQVRAAEQRAQARAARERSQARAHRDHQQRVHQQRVHQQRVHQQRVHRHRAPVRRQSVNGRHYHPFYASPIYVQRGRPQYHNNVFAVDGYMQDDGYQCVQLRDDQGNPYILEGRVEGLFAGDHVRLVAREAPFSSCGGYGRPVIVTRVVRVWADPHHRSAYYQTRIDGPFDNWASWRRGNDWLRDPRFYDGPYDAGYEDDYYFDGYDYDRDDYAYYDDGGW